jgi:hypothetical protein
MDRYQFALYKQAENEILRKADADAMASGNEKPSSALNTFLNKTRAISNNTQEFGGPPNSPKFKSILSHIEEENRFPVLIYSFFLKSGVYAIEDYLKQYSTIHITGETKTDETQQIVDSFNKGKYDILLISGAAGFGLDLKGVRQIHIMEPTWNKAKIDQVIGRGVRYKSHQTLPFEERYVNIYHWLSVLPRSWWTKVRPSADEYLYNMSITKHSLTNLFKDFVCQASIENNMLLDKNVKYDKYTSGVKKKGRI